MSFLEQWNSVRSASFGDGSARASLCARSSRGGEAAAFKPMDGFPTYNFAGTGPGAIRGCASMIVVLLTPEAAVWQDVVLYWNPS